MPRGVRLNPKHDARTRAKIQTSQIINRLMKFINGEVEMSASQVTASLGLLKKSLPDLQSIEMTGELNHNHENLDLSTLSKAELEALEHTLKKATVIEGSAGGNSTAESDQIH